MNNHKAPIIKKHPVTWILVADGKRAQIYTKHVEEKIIPLAGTGKHRHYREEYTKALLPVLDSPLQAESETDFDVSNNKLGRVFESANSAHHMKEPHINVHDEIKKDFTKTIAAQINGARIRKAFDRLVLIAPDRMIAELKKHLNQDVLQRMVAMLAKDLTHCDPRELAERLERVA